MANGEVLRGSAFVWGTKGLSATGVTISTSTARIQSDNLDRSSEKATVENESGETCGEAYYNFQKKLSLTLKVIGSTISDAQTNVDALCAKPGTIITFTDSLGAMIDGVNTGKYLVDTAKRVATNKDCVIVEIECHQFEDNDTAVAVS